MTAKAQRDEWRALEKKATAGPWEWERRGFEGATLSLMMPVVFHGHAVHPMNLLNTDAREWDWNGEPNRAFIAAARTAVPALLDENERLRVLLARAVKYAHEDRAKTPGSTRLARALDEARALLEVE